MDHVRDPRGQDREVRNVLRHLGLHVSRLIRVSSDLFSLPTSPRAKSKRCRRACCAISLAKSSHGWRARISPRRSCSGSRSPSRLSERRGGPTRAACPPPPASERRRGGGVPVAPARRCRSGVGGRPNARSVPLAKFARPRRGENARPSFDERDEPRQPPAAAASAPADEDRRRPIARARARCTEVAGHPSDRGPPA